MTTSHNRPVEGVSRRQFLRITGATLALTTMGTITDWAVRPAKAAPNPAFNRIVIINFRGGNDGANMVVPINAGLFPTYQGTVLRPTLRIPPPGSGAGPRPDALALNGTADYGFNSVMTSSQALYNSGNGAIIHKVGYQSANLSHFASEDIWSFGVRGSFQGLGVPQFSGWISRFADLETLTAGPGSPAEAMGVVSVGQGNLKDFNGGQTAAPLQLSSAANFQFAGERVGAYADNHIYRLQVIAQTLDNRATDGSLRDDVAAAMKQAHDLSAQVQTTLDDYNTVGPNTTYPNTGLGRRLRDIAALIYGGFNTKIFYTGFGGFDTHSGQGARHDQLLTEFDGALGTFVSDLQTMGVWASTKIVVISEFGRRNFENGSQGTDHGHANPALVFGGTLNGGVYGSMTDSDFNTGNGYLPYERDFRTIYERLLTNHLGVTGTVGDTGTNLGQIFPEVPQAGFDTVPTF